MRTTSPQTEMQCPCAEGELHEQSRVAPPPVVIEVRRCSAHTDELHVDVQPVAGADHVPEQPAVAVDVIARRLHREAHRRTRRQEPLCDRDACGP